jgi:hypothetical protein
MTMASRDSENAAGSRSVLADFASTSSRVVQTAAMILEQEIAAGMAAAKEVSAQMAVAVKHAPNAGEANYSQIIERLKADAHAAVDVLVNLLKTAGQVLTEAAGAADRDRSGRASRAAKPKAVKKSGARKPGKKK